MGRFIYDTLGNSVEIDDRTLAHLRIVMMNKLRRSEPFMFDVDLPRGGERRSYWIHPSVPLLPTQKLPLTQRPRRPHLRAPPPAIQRVSPYR